MKNKLLYIIGAAGLLAVIGFFILEPSFFARFITNGGFRSDWTVAKIHMMRYFLLVIGVVVLVWSIIVSRLPKANFTRYFLIATSLIGIAIIVLGVRFTPAWVEQNFTNIKFIEDHNLVSLVNIQFAAITLGFIVLLLSLIIFRFKYLPKTKPYAFILLASLFIIYFLMFHQTYLKEKYPANIILKPSEYVKVLDLLLGQDILLSDFDPQPTLVVERKKITKAKYPVIDINVHINSAFQTEEDRKVLSPENLLKAMDSVGVRIIVNTDGTVNGYNNLDEALNLYSRKYPDRFITFYPSWFPPIIVDDNFLADLPRILEEAVKKGVKGNGETWKHLGLRTRDVTGKVIPVDDPRIDPLWAKAGELGIPVLWHMGDPAPMFLPVDRFNERYIELGRFPEWSFYGPRFPSRETIHKGRENVLRKHQNTIFIGCHMGWNSDNLAYAAYLLDTYPNYYLDMSTTLSELGRQPYTARKFFIKYQDRILFGTDGGAMFGQKGWTVEKFYQAHFEFLETENEYIDYPMQGAINQGSWKIYGINLPDSVLQKIYYKNAEKILKIKIDETQK